MITAASLFAFGCLANFWFEWGVFGRFDRQVAVFGFVMLAFVFHFFAVSRDELRAYRDERTRDGSRN